MNDFYDFATLLIDKEKIEKVIQRKASIIQRAFEEKAKAPERIISLEFHSILVDFALQGLDVSYISENKKLIKYVDSLCKQFDVKIKNHNMPLDAFCVKYHMNKDKQEPYDAVLALDQYFTYANSEDQQRTNLHNALSLLHTEGILLTSLMDYKNIKFNNKMFTEPFYISTAGVEYILVSYRKWDQEDRKKWMHYSYAIDQTNKKMTVFEPHQRQAMFFKQLAYHTASAGWTNFTVHKKLLYKPIYSNSGQYIISVTQ